MKKSEEGGLMKIIDISRDLLTAPVYEGDPVPEHEWIKTIGDDSQYSLSAICACLHNGTHIDAPSHFLIDGESIEEYSLEKFIGPCKVLEVSEGIITGQTVEDYFPRDCKRVLIKSHGRAFIHETAAEVMALYGYDLIGTDSTTVEMPGSDGAAHRALLRSDIAILEGLNLDEAGKGDYFLIAPPVRIDGAEASFTRALLVADYIFWSNAVK